MTSMFNKFGIAAVAWSSFAMAAPASAIVTFAQFSATSQDSNIRWVNNGVASNSAVSNTANGSGGFFYTTSSAIGTVPAAVAVNFEFLQPQLVFLGPISANFFMDVTVASGNPATAAGALRIQNVPTGSFSFTSTQAVTVGGTTYGIGSNLLTGTFTTGTIVGSSSSGAFSGNAVDGTLIYSSALLDFTNTIDRDFALGLTSITQSLFRTDATTSLRTFRALGTGSFSSDPAPLVIDAPIPEPQTWAMLVIGFGMVGLTLRGRKSATVVA